MIWSIVWSILQAHWSHQQSGQEQERVAWIAQRNLPCDDPQYAAAVMDAVAAQNPRVRKPVYHVSLSAPPGERLSRAEWEDIADRFLRHLKLDQHQVLMVAHRDTDHQHVHLMINRVDIETHKAWDNGHDYARRERALRLIERELKLREVPGPHFRLAGQERPDRDRGLTTGERQEKARTGGSVWAEEMRDRLHGPVKTATSWAELEARLKEHGLHLRKRGRGLVITDGERMVKASRVHRSSSYGKLAERFGSSFEDWRRDWAALVRAAKQAERLERYRAELERRSRRFQTDAVRTVDVLQEGHRLDTALKCELRTLDSKLRLTYRPGELPAVRERLHELISREGLPGAAQVINDTPEKLGRLHGVAIAGYGTDDRLRAVWNAHFAAQTLDKLHELQVRQRHLRPLVHQAEAERKTAQVRGRKAAELLRAAPVKQVEKQLAKLGMKLGMKAVELLLPAKLVLPVKAAVRAVTLARGRESGRGMEM